VLVGTRFSAANEALTAPGEEAHRRGERRCDGPHHRVRRRAWLRRLGRHNGRALRNKFTDTWHGREAELVANQDAEGARYRKAVERQDFDTALIFAGEAVDLIDSVLPAAELVRRIVH